jgi:hypothetical protein
VGERAARLVRLRWTIWAIVVLPLLALLLFAIVIVRVLNVPVADFGPSILVVVVLLVLSALVLPFVSMGMVRRASFEAGTYLNTARYTGSNRLPIGVVTSRPRILEHQLLIAGIPPHGESGVI